MPEEVLNFQTFDPFAAAGPGDQDTRGSQIHIRVQQRNNRKRLTTLQGLPLELDVKTLLKRLRRALSCNGCIVQDDEYGEVIQLQGDKRRDLVAYLKKHQIGDDNSIHIHGA